MSLACAPGLAYLWKVMDTQAPPTAQTNDGDDVRWALETANAVWTQGDRRAALSWIRRAAEAAAESGSDDRALQLARAGADLRSALEIPRTLPPPANVPTIPRPPAEPAAPESVPPKEPKKRVRHHAVRVAVTLSPDHDGAFLAWPLKPDEAPPSNAHEALFIATDPNADLFIFKG